MDKKLYRDDLHKTIGGVCAGLANYFGIDVSLIRLAFLLTLILKGGGLLIYIILWIVLPKKPVQFQQSAQFQNPVVDYTVPPAGQQQPVPPVFMQPKQKSNFGIIAGGILVFLGVVFMMNEFNLIPDWDFDHLWPLVFIGAGVLVLFSGKKNKPWEQPTWNKPDNSTEINPSYK